MILIIITLALMEISLSFDNAIMNAGVLKRQSKGFQTLFLTLGWGTGVVLVRFLLPAIIVGITASMPLKEVFTLLTDRPDLYSQYMKDCHDSIAAFGGTFLILLFFGFIIEDNDNPWHGVEKYLRDNREGFAVTMIIGGLIVGVALQIPFIPAACGIICYLSISLLDEILTNSKTVYKGILAFLYLEILDASFSLDGVVAAFSITSDISVIMIGLAIGSLAIRSLTVNLVNRGVISQLIYLEHGAMWAIGALGALMWIGTKVAIPDAVNAATAIVIIGAAAIHSVIDMNRA